MYHNNRVFCEECAAKINSCQSCLTNIFCRNSHRGCEKILPSYNCKRCATKRCATKRCATKCTQKCDDEMEYFCVSPRSN